MSQVALELMIRLPLPSSGWDYRNAPDHFPNKKALNTDISPMLELWLAFTTAYVFWIVKWMFQG